MSDRCWIGLAAGIVVCVAAPLPPLWAQPPSEPRVVASTPATDAPRDVLSPDEWRRVDASVDRALAWLAGEQQSDGSFPTLDAGQPGVTALCVMAFISHGHMPGAGRYGPNLERATDFVLGCQKENGLVTLIGPEGPEITRQIEHDLGVSAAYNHAIASLMLSELYGMSGNERAAQIQKVVGRSIRATLTMQRWPKDHAEDRGGWRYVDNFDDNDSDLSITGWSLMFLRSSRNAGFDVPKSAIDDAVGYVRRSYSRRYGAFGYTIHESDPRSRCMAGAGILALAHAGYHNSPEALQSAAWLQRYNFDNYNQLETFDQSWYHDRYHYGLFNCCQAMYQLGGRYWEDFFPRTVHTLLENQQPDGSWPAESHFHDGQFGNAYTTALVLMTLGAPNQLLPIFQR
jgi:hypothetical protein